MLDFSGRDSSGEYHKKNPYQMGETLSYQTSNAKLLIERRVNEGNEMAALGIPRLASCRVSSMSDGIKMRVTSERRLAERRMSKANCLLIR